MLQSKHFMMHITHFPNFSFSLESQTQAFHYCTIYHNSGTKKNVSLSNSELRFNRIMLKHMMKNYNY